jgi:hypothetical protein
MKRKRSRRSLRAQLAPAIAALRALSELHRVLGHVRALKAHVVAIGVAAADSRLPMGEAIARRIRIAHAVLTELAASIDRCNQVGPGFG